MKGSQIKTLDTLFTNTAMKVYKTANKRLCDVMLYTVCYHLVVV